MIVVIVLMLLIFFTIIDLVEDKIIFIIHTLLVVYV